MTEPTPPAPAHETPSTPAQDARLLLRAARAGTLATSADGQPFASLVTPATAPDGGILLLLSDLSEHTRHLRAEPRCAVLVTGAADGPNPQTAPRLTVTGLASIEPDPALKARWVALHPYAAFYADFGDFALWRIRPMAGLFVGGFARATRLRRADLVPDEAAVAAVAAAEAGVMEHCNQDHAQALAAIAAAHGLDGDGWLMAACDADGFDLANGEVARRIAWPAPVDGPGAIRAALVNLADAARNR
jgi:putative heme iron utilization protein